MNTITVGPTLSNPNAFETVQELREELHRANATLLDSCERLHRLAMQHNNVLNWIELIATHHKSGNADEVRKLLDGVVASQRHFEKNVH